MSSKTRGRYENINSPLTTSIISQQQYVPSLLKIESVVPTRNHRNHHANKLIYRSYSTLGNTTTNYKHVSKSKINTNLHRHKAHPSRIEPSEVSKDPVEVNGSQIDNSIIVENGVYKIRRSAKERDKQPDRINLDRRGLSAIPLIESEPNLRLLSLQHNFINVFHIPDHNEGHEDVEKADTNNNNVCRTDNENRSILSGHTNIPNGNYNKLGNPSKPFLKQKSMSRHQLNVNLVGKTASPTSFQKSYLLQNKPPSVLKKSNSLMINNYTPQAPTPTSTTNFMLFKNKLIATPSFSHEVSANSVNSTDSNNCALQIAAIGSPVTVIRSNFSNLVFLDLYNNQIEKIANLDGLKSLTVLLLGKNRISDISGIVALKQLRVLDLHGNKIANVTNKISQLQELKSLNLAGNLLTKIMQTDFAGLFCLKELNLKRNKIKKLSGFTDLTQLERLWLCNNELPSIEDMQSLAKSVNLKEITIENNPISLAGDCVSFLVSYLPLLVSLNQMQITEQVRRAANAWRKSKENSDKNYQHLTSDVCSNIRREEIISNARTNWELIRSQQSNIINGKNSRDIIKPAPKPSNVSVTMPSQKYSSSSSNSTVSSNIQPENGLHRNNKVANGYAKKSAVDSIKKMNRSSSQENTGSGSLLSEQDNEPDEYFHLPPILTPFLEPQKNPSASSMRPNVDSDSACSSDIEEKQSPKKKSSVPTTPPIFVSLPPSPFELRITTDEDVSDKQTSYTPPLPNVEPDIYPIPVKAKSPIPPNEDETKSKTSKEFKDKPTLTIVDNFNGMSLQPVAENSSKSSLKQSGYNSPRIDQDMDKLSTLTQNSTAKNSSDSINTLSSMNEAASSNFSSHSAKKPVHNKRHHMQLVRAQTARNLTVNHTSHASHLQNQMPINQSNNQVKQQQNSNKIDKDREQGGDFLVEICGRYLNVYGNGALKFVDKPWNVQKANDVHTVKFSYINFNSISPILCRIKPRFQNVEHYVFRG